MSYFETRYNFNEKRNVVWREIVRWISARFPLGSAILDAGCGYGDFINNVARGGAVGAAKLVAMDLAPEAAKKIVEGVEFRAGSVAEIGSAFPQATFDFVFSSNVLEHLERRDVTKFFEGARSVLKPGGHVAILMPNYRRAYREYFDDYTHVTAISDISLADWMKASGFEVVYSHPGLLPYSMKDSKLPVTWWLVRLFLALPFKPGGKQMFVVGKKP